MVMRCRRRNGNRPEKIFGPTRAELLHTRCEKRRRYRHGRALRKPMQDYEAAISEYSYPYFRLYEPDVELIVPELRKLGPGGIPYDPYHVDLEAFDPSTSQDYLHALALRAFDVGRQFNAVATGDVYNTPCVIDTGCSNGLTPFKSDFIDYTDINLMMKGIRGDGQIVGTGTVLTRVRCRDNTYAYVADVKYHMPDADIRLSSPQNNDGKFELVGKNMEWRLPDGRIVDIRMIDPRSNLPLLTGDFVCNSEEKHIHGSRYVNSVAYAHKCEYIAPKAL